MLRGLPDRRTSTSHLGRTKRRRRFYDVREAIRSIKMEDYDVVALLANVFIVAKLM